ncbi:hypothetical protein [Paenibacillus sp. D51F]
MKRRELTHPIHFHTAILDQVPVLVFMGLELIGTGRIQSFETHASEDLELQADIVTIKGEHYIREQCRFEFLTKKASTAG